MTNLIHISAVISSFYHLKLIMCITQCNRIVKGCFASPFGIYYELHEMPLITFVCLSNMEYSRKQNSWPPGSGKEHPTYVLNCSCRQKTNRYLCKRVLSYPNSQTRPADRGQESWFGSLSVWIWSVYC